jgi:putative membrane protein
MFRTALMVAAVAALTSVQAQDRKPDAPYSDAAFVTKAANCCSCTMQALELAATNGKSEAVRKFAKNMIDDHKKTKEKLDAAAKTTSQSIPDKLDAEHQKCIDTLKGLKDEEFDKAFLAETIKGHEKAITEFKQAKAETKDEAVKEFVVATLPMLEKHLDIAKKIQAAGR